MTRLNIENDDRADSPGRREADQQPGVAKVLGITLGVITLLSLVFTAGYNWRGVDELRKNEDQFVRKDVISEQLHAFSFKIDELSRQIEELRGEQRDARRKP